MLTLNYTNQAPADGETKGGKTFEERLAELKKPEAVPQPKATLCSVLVCKEKLVDRAMAHCWLREWLVG